MRPIFILYNILLSICIANAAHCQESNKTLVRSIKAYAHPLTGTNPTIADSDLTFLQDVLNDKTVIGLGESTHGTKEFFQMKHRILKYLVEEMGYRVFAMEANFSECNAINDYILYGKGDSEEALRGIYFWTWNTVEVLEMIKWMRQYNMGKTDIEKIHFWGFDMQYAPGAAKAVKYDLKNLQINYTEYQTMLDSFASSRYYMYRMDSSAKSIALEHLKNLRKYSIIYKDGFIKNTSEREYSLHCQHINIMLQAVENMVAENGYRDSCMAENIKWIANFEETKKIVLWAHNAHINKWKVNTTSDEYQMGFWLNKLYGNKYYAIGFDFNSGSFRAKTDNFGNPNHKSTVIEYSIHKKVKQSSNNVFSKTQIPIFFLDYKSANEDPNINNFLSTETKTKIISALYLPKWEKSYYHKQILNKTYDATIYINKTTASVPIASYTKYVQEQMNTK